MTKPREPGSFEDAALEIVRNLTVQACARLVDVTPSAVRQYTDPDRDGRPTLHKALVLDAEHFRRFGHAPFLESYAAQLQALVPERPERQVSDLLAEALDVPEAVGQLMGLIRRCRDVSSPDGARISANERAELGKVLKSVRAQLDDVEACIRKAGK